jgi:hypothetical protein
MSIVLALVLIVRSKGCRALLDYTTYTVLIAALTSDDKDKDKEPEGKDKKGSDQAIMRASTQEILGVDSRSVTMA